MIAASWRVRVILTIYEIYLMHDSLVLPNFQVLQVEAIMQKTGSWVKIVLQVIIKQEAF